MRKVRVTEDWMRGGIQVQSANYVQDGRILVRNFNDDSVTTVLERGAHRVDYTENALFLDDDEARALWEELCRYYGTHPSTATDRADLVAERARAEKLIDAMIKVATR